jgi:hypothetical protein
MLNEHIMYYYTQHKTYLDCGLKGQVNVGAATAGRHLEPVKAKTRFCDLEA